jgi:1,4-dihydroxy-2-naphthoate octaprenyltransferase
MHRLPGFGECMVLSFHGVIIVLINYVVRTSHRYIASSKQQLCRSRKISSSAVRVTNVMECGECFDK